jgi:protein phosphatase
LSQSPTSTSALWSVRAAILTDRGQVRTDNEDAVYLEPAGSHEARARGLLCIVADGMGGYAAGEVASRMAVQAVRNRYYAGSSTFIVDALRIAIEGANQDVWQAAQRQPETTGMGCTLTAVVILGVDLVVGHVGDSRAYLLRDNEIAQVTRDHSWVAEQVEAGALTPEQANRHPQRNVILRALGARATVEVDIIQDRVLDGDILVLCSDGLSTVLEDEQIGRIVLDSSPEQAVRQLVILANKRGAPDNVTVAVLRVSGPTQSWISRLRGWWPLATAGAVLLVLAATLTFLTGTGSRQPVPLAIEPAPSPDTAAWATAISTPPPVSAVLTSAPAARTPPTMPSQSVLNETARVAAGEVHLRSRADLTPDTVKESLNEGEIVRIIERAEGPVPDNETDSTWDRVEVPRLQETGWIYGRYVTDLSGTVSTTPSATPAPTAQRL